MFKNSPDGRLVAVVPARSCGLGDRHALPHDPENNPLCWVPGRSFVTNHGPTGMVPSDLVHIF